MNAPALPTVSAGARMSHRIVTACHAAKLAAKTSACVREPVTFDPWTGFMRHVIGNAVLFHLC